MSVQEIATLLRATAFAALFWASLQFMIWPTFTSAFRRTLFLTRQDLFLYAAEGNVSTDDPAYVEIRTTLNGLIRYAERLTLFRLVLAISRSMAEGHKYDHRLREMIAAHPVDVQKTLMAFRERAGAAVIHHVIAISPFGWALFVIAKLRALFHIDNKKVVSTRSAAVNAVEAETVMMEQLAVA